MDALGEALSRLVHRRRFIFRFRPNGRLSHHLMFISKIRWAMRS